MEKFSHLVAASLDLKLVDEATAEQALLRFLRSGRPAALSPVLQGALDKAGTYFKRFGFAIPKATEQRLALFMLPDDNRIELYCDYSCVINLQPMLGWADAATRSAVFKGIKAVQGAFWNSVCAAEIYEFAFGYEEALSLIPDDLAAAPDFDALWAEAQEQVEIWDDSDGQPYIMGIGGREEFEEWMGNHITARRGHEAFLKAPCTGRLNPDRCKKAHAWARRAIKLGTAFREEVKPWLWAERGEHREFAEQCLILTGPNQSPLVDDYFHRTDEMNGESPGIDFVLVGDAEKPSGLIQAMAFAISTSVVFAELKALL